MNSYWLLILLFNHIPYLINSTQKTGLKITLLSFNYTQSIPSRPSQLNEIDYKFFLILDKFNGSVPQVIYKSNDLNNVQTLQTPSEKEFVLTEDKIVDLNHKEYDIKYTIGVGDESIYLDTLILTNRLNFFHISCNPCIGLIKGHIFTYGTLKIFYISISKGLNFVTAIVLKITVYPTEQCFNSLSCHSPTLTHYGCDFKDVDRGSSVVVDWNNITNNIVYRLRKHSNWDYSTVQAYTQDKIEPLFDVENKIGFAAYHYSNQPPNCYNDIVIKKNFTSYPYDLTVLKEKVGETQQMTATVLFYYGSYKYGGLKSQFPFENYNNYTKCSATGKKICGDPYKKLPDCNTDTSICSMKPCKNDGACYGIGTNYYCICKYGSYGKQCENIFCDQTCNNSKCNKPNECGPCFPGFTGTNCSIPTCSNFTGCNNGSCHTEGGIRKCICNIRQYTGEKCQFKCPNLCKNGYCKVINNVTKCACEQGYSGDSCDIQRKNTEIYEASIKFLFFISLYTFGGVLILLIIFILILGIVKVEKTNINRRTNTVLRKYNDQRTQQSTQRDNSYYNTDPKISFLKSNDGQDSYQPDNDGVPEHLQSRRVILNSYLVDENSQNSNTASKINNDIQYQSQKRNF